MNFDGEPEITDVLDGEDTPRWVLDTIDLAAGVDPEEAALWMEALALGFGRRANRIRRDDTDFDSSKRR